MAADDTKNGNEVDIINSAILNQDQNEITKLDPIITSYQTLLGNMLKDACAVRCSRFAFGICKFNQQSSVRFASYPQFVH